MNIIHHAEGREMEITGNDGDKLGWKADDVQSNVWALWNEWVYKNYVEEAIYTTKCNEDSAWEHKSNLFKHWGKRNYLHNIRGIRGGGRGGGVKNLTKQNKNIGTREQTCEVCMSECVCVFVLCVILVKMYTHCLLHSCLLVSIAWMI